MQMLRFSLAHVENVYLTTVVAQFRTENSAVFGATDDASILTDAAWSMPREIAKYPNGWANHPGPNAAVQLRPGSAHAGRLVFAGWLHNTGTTCDAIVWYSDDGGESFLAGKGGRINGAYPRPSQIVAIVYRNCWSEQVHARWVCHRWLTAE